MKGSETGMSLVTSREAPLRGIYLISKSPVLMWEKPG